MKKLTHISTAFILVLLLSPFNKSYAQPPCTNNWISFVEMDSGSAGFVAVNEFTVTPSQDVFMGFKFLGRFHADNNVELKGTGTTGAFSDVGFIGFSHEGKPLWGVQSRNQPFLTQVTTTFDYDNNVLFSGMAIDSVIDLGGKNLILPQKRGIYLAKFNLDSTLLDLFSLASFPATHGLSLNYDIKTDKNNNIYLFGMFSGTVSFDTIIASTISPSHYDLFVAKYNSKGEIQWISHDGNNTGFVLPRGLALDEEGSLVGIAEFSEDINFNNQVTRHMGAFGANDVLIVKWDSSGSFQWGQSAYSLGTDNAFKVHASGTDYYITGTCGQAFIYDGDTILTSNRSRNGFLMKIDSNGDLVWSNINKGAAFASHITTLNDGRVVATTAFSDTVDIFGQQFISQSQNKGFNSCISVLSADGSLIKNIPVKSTNRAVVAHIVALPNNDVIIRGILNDNAQIVNRQVNSPGKQRIFVMRTCIDDLLKVNTPLQRELTAQDMRVKVFPNPANETLFMELAANDDYEITVSDISGRVQLRETYSTRGNSTTFELNCSTLSNGMYLIRVNSKKSFSGYAKFYKN